MWNSWVCEGRDSGMSVGAVRIERAIASLIGGEATLPVTSETEAASIESDRCRRSDRIMRGSERRCCMQGRGKLSGSTSGVDEEIILAWTTGSVKGNSSRRSYWTRL